MPEWSAPLWLAGLAAVPLLWWLHRFRRQGAPFPVSALFLWAGPATTADSRSRPARADPWWHLRALLITLLVLGMAGPHWPGSTAPDLEIWFDDSPSLQTLEDGTPRTQLALAALDDALTQRDNGEVLIHSLSDPARQLRLDPRQREGWTTQLENWLQTAPGELALPPARQMSLQHEHWLVSDGAHATLAKWLEQVPVSRVIQVGRQTENVALRRLALRPDSARPDRVKGLATVENLGRAEASRRLEISSDGLTLATFPVKLAAGERRHYPFTLDTIPVTSVQASITPADSLPNDDVLAVAPQSFTALPTHIDDNCGPHLRTALDSHPGLRIIGTEQQAELHIVCGSKPPPADGIPTIWLHATAPTVEVTTAPLWHSTAGPLRHLVLQPSWLRRFSPAESPAGTPLLRAGKDPLVVYRSQPEPQVEILIDAEFPPWTKRPEYPLFLAGLIDRVQNRPVLDTVGSAGRPREASLIVPHPLHAGVITTSGGKATSSRDLSLYFILGAALLLGLDIRRQLHARTPAPGGSAS